MLVAKGFTQTEGIDYFDTFSLVVKMITIRVILSVAAAKQWHLHELDVNTTFLHGDLNEVVYIKVPSGLQTNGSSLVCKLQKSLYGLKQASRQWHAKLTNVLINSGYTKSNSDHSLFIKITSSSFSAILVYRKYSLDLLQECALLVAKPNSTPMEYSGKLIHYGSGIVLSDASSYRRLMGKLVYLTHTRPYISFVVGHLSQFLSSPTNHHFNAAIRILKYIKGCLSNGVFFSAQTDFQLKGYSDSDWAGCPDTRRSVSGYCFFIGQSLVSWKSKKQRFVSRSSVEAEYKAMTLASCEAQWLVSLLHDLGLSHS
ncbi:PREDICTED: uncharacterized protein LOC109330910 [Lupinus angustifolius]|uniref:uncharacterized protein LOC109330910 n=1 Tax=Lupinus angustifolius TaxID=3871 RepID=UPI00092E977D|nr:PREDICTED: uncharacterized protein LOC109330910 [Lupinus angustifolius]